MSTTTRSWGGRGAQTPVVASTAAINGLGFNSHQTWAFWRAEVTPLVASPFRLNNGERATMAHVRTLDPKATGGDRLAALVVEALAQLEPGLAAMNADARLKVSLCVSERLGQLGDPYFGPQRRQLERALVGWFATHDRAPEIEVVARGHAGFAQALLEGCDAVMADTLDAVVVGGVDSAYDPLVVDILMEQERIFDQVQTDGFIPGEGAALAIVTRHSRSRHWSLPTLARIETVARSAEPVDMSSDAPSTGLGLTSAMKACTDRLREEHRRLEWLLGDLTNETYRAQEFQLAFPRAFAPGGLDTAGQSYREVTIDDLQGSFLPAVFGDLGAATMPTALVLATEAFARGRPNAGNCLIIGSSEGEERGAVLLSRQPSGDKARSEEGP